MSLAANEFYIASPSAPVVLKAVSVDEPGPDDVIVEVAYAALNPIDLKLKPLMFFGGKTVRDFSGTITKVGSNVRDFQVGDNVAGFRSGVASFMKFNVRKEHILAKLPTGIDHRSAASLPVAVATSWSLILAGPNPEPGSTILVLGGSTSVGAALTQLLKKHFNVGRVVVSASTASTELVKQYGADEVIDYNSSTFVQDVVRAGKYALVYDTVGGYEFVQRAKEVLEQGGYFLTIAGDHYPSGGYGSAFNLEFFAALPFVLCRSAFGWLWGVNYKFVPTSPSVWVDHADIAMKHSIKVAINSEFAAADVQKAWQLLGSPRPPRGKILLKL